MVLVFQYASWRFFSPTADSRFSIATQPPRTAEQRYPLRLMSDMPPGENQFPEISCEAVFEPAEWKSVYYVVCKTPPPSSPPTLQEMVRMVAQLGGYVNRKRTDEPDPQTVWLGLQRTHDIANCWLIFGPESENEEILV